MPRATADRTSRRLLAIACAPLLCVPLLAQAEVDCAVPATDNGAASPYIESLLSRMTLEEKLGQLNQVGSQATPTGPQATDGTPKLRPDQYGSVLGMAGAAETRRAQAVAVEQTRLGIPLLFAYDVIHGFRTVFPVPLAEAATFDPVAVENAARIAAVEATAAGIHWTYAPMVDIARDPRWGRIVEGAGEDPYLGAAMAAARVRGFQGRDLRADDTLLATAKHFAAYGAAEGGRDYNIADVPERTLRDVYLPPFQAAIDAGAQSVMAAFNEVDGVPMHANRGLIDGVLRKQWKFDGVVVSDYTGIAELLAHGVAANRADAGALALHAGVDVDMISDIYRKDLPALVRDGRVPVAEVDASVRRLLQAKCRLGLFDDPYRYSDTTRERARTLTAAHRKAARDVATASFVLLKNARDTLPLRDGIGTLAVIGPFADDKRAMLGSWAGQGKPEDVVSPMDGLRARLGTRTRIVQARGATANGNDRSGFAEALRVAKQADAVVLFLGEDPDLSGEASSRASLDLPGVQEALALEIAATGKPVVVVLFNGRPLTIGALDANVPAILEAWYPGIEAGHALADVLFGDVSPSGRLPVTFPRAVGQVPLYAAHKNTGRPPKAGEKYSSKYLDVPWTPLYPFGHGHGYTRVRYDDVRVAKASIGLDEAQEVSVTLTNTGARAGNEVVQLYLRDDVGSVTRPVRMLRGFRRVALQPGETKTVVFPITPGDLAFTGLDMRRVVEPGTFTVYAGGDPAALRESKFEVVAR